MSDLEPVTREEKLLDGQDLEPITRKEKFIKRIYDKTQIIPEPVTREEYFLKKAGEGGGGDVTIEQLNVSENGTYSEEGKAYSPVVVNVPSAVLGSLSVTENGTYTPPSGVDGYNEVNVNVPLPQNALLLKDIPSTPTAIATFSDGAEMVMPSLKVAIEPQQDLHGYDSPWVGGAGKNKFDIEGWLNSSGATYTKSGNTYTITATSALFTTPFTFSDTDVAISASASSYVAGTATVIRMQLLDSDNRVVDELVANQSYQKREGLVASKVRFDWSAGGTFTITEPQIELGSTATSFAPYSNICPIIGWDEAVVTVADDVDNPTVEHEYTIDLNGTRYGGTLDVVSGVLTVDRAYVDLGTLDYSYYSGNLFTALISNLKPVPNAILCNALCSIYVAKQGNEYASIDGSFVAGFNNAPTLAIHDSRFTDATSFKTAMDGVKLVYELATPLTIQLTPTAVKSLEGENNLFADSGQILDGEYLSKGV